MNQDADTRAQPKNGVSSPTFWITVASMVAVVVAIFGSDFVRQKRIDARQAQCATHLSTISFMLHHYADRNGEFPKDLESPTGEPLLSWRVELLSVIDPELYRQFNTQEAWDSKGNSLLQSKMPHIYCCPSDLQAKSAGTTSYYAVVPPSENRSQRGAATFDFDSGVDDQCILLVESSDLKIPWTKPGDYTGDPCSPSLIDPGLTNSACEHPGGTYVVRVNLERESLKNGNKKQQQ